MQKLKTFLRRLRTMSLARMKMYADKAAAESGRSSVSIMLDMVYCTFAYGVGYLDYLTFGFAHQKAAARRTFMNMNDNLRLVRSLNDNEARDVFEDKLKFANAFSEFMRRDFIDLRKVDADGLCSFCEKSGVVFAKKTHDFGGHGVERLRAEDISDRQALYERLMHAEMYLVEQGVEQHPEMNRLSPKSVNTVRVVTLEKGGEIYVMYSLVRMGSGDSFVDNISSGGMYAPLNEKGIITAPAFCDKLGEYFEEHPATHTRIVGFEVPMFAEAVEMCRRAARRVEGVRYIGWDVAIAADGPLLIEGNTIPSYDMCQNYRHLGPDKLGIKPRFVEVLGEEFYQGQ